MDRASLRSMQDQPGMPAGIRDLPPTAAALLVEYQCETEELERSARRSRLRSNCSRICRWIAEPTFTRRPGRTGAMWRVRKG